MTDTRRRVKLYALNAERQWDDRGTGHVSSVHVDRLDGISLVVRAESDSSLLLESKIQPDTAYQKQQDTLIVWSEGDNFDLALSFQERTGCDEIWERICEVQGKDPSVEITQEIVEESEDERFEEMSDSAPPIELPPCEVPSLEDISEIIASCLTSPLRKEKLAFALETESYIKQLLIVFTECEEAQNMEALHHLFEIFKNIFLLNKNALFDIMFTEDTIFDVIGCLEYDPSYPHRKKHRQYLKNLAKFRQAIPITNRDLLAKIHQTFRVQYIQDVVLPTPSVFEDNMLNTLSSFIFFNKVEIVTVIQDDEKFLCELFVVLTDKSTSETKRRDIVLFLKELCSFAQNLQPPGKDSFYKTLNCLGVLAALELSLSATDKKTKQASVDILTTIVEYSPSMVREFVLDQAKTNNDNEDSNLINIIINEMFNDPEPELGGAVKLMGVIKLLIDPENMVTSINKTEKADFLNLFYRKSIVQIIKPLLLHTAGNKPPDEDYHTVQILGLILELLSFCAEHHSYHVRHFILEFDLLRRIIVLMKSSHTFLVLGALRYLRKIMSLKDEFYYRYMISAECVEAVVDAFIRNNGRYNLLESAILELFEFIRIEDIKLLCKYAYEKFGKLFDEVEYVQTFKNLKLKYEQYQNRFRDRDRNNLDSIQSQILRNSRYRRDQRQLEEEEEMWFNTEDEFTDDSYRKTDMDSTLGKLMERKSEALAFLTASLEGHHDIPVGQVSSIISRRLQMHQQQQTTNNDTGASHKTTVASVGSTDPQKSSNLSDFIAEEFSSSTKTTSITPSSSTSPSSVNTNTITSSTKTTSSVVDSSGSRLGIKEAASSAIKSGDSLPSQKQLTNAVNGDNSKDDGTAAVGTDSESAKTAISIETSISSSLSDDNSTSSSSSNSSDTNTDVIGSMDGGDIKDSKSEEYSLESANDKQVAFTETEPAVNDSKAAFVTTNLESTATVAPSVKKGLVDYEGDSDEEDEEEIENTPPSKKQRVV